MSSKDRKVSKEEKEDTLYLTETEHKELLSEIKEVIKTENKAKEKNK